MGSRGAGNTIAASNMTEVVLCDPTTGVPYSATGGGGGGGSGFVESLWTDDTAAYFVRSDNGTAITWFTISGSSCSAPGTGARPAGGTSAVIDRSGYQATAGGTGFSSGDLLDHFTIMDPASGAVIGNFWINATTSAKLTSGPSAGSIVPISPLPTGAATAVNQPTSYASPDARKVAVVTNGAILFTDDFGGAAVDTAVRWDVIDGGLGANPTLHSQTLTQAKIGSGTTGMTDSVSGSALTVTMGTTLGAERWYLSQQAFAGAEDLLILLSKSQALAANSIWIGLVEVDPTTLIPLLNPNLAADGNGACQFTNMGGVEFGQTATATAYAANAIGDSSGAIATGSTATAIAALTTLSEFVVEYHSEDIIASNATVDSAAAKGATPSRVSTQVPNDGKVYKLLMRLRNVTTPGTSTTVTIARIMMWDSQEMRVEVVSGRGDTNGQKAVGVNVSNTALVTLTGTNSLSLIGNTSGGLPSTSWLRLHAALAATGFIKNAAGQAYIWDLLNTSAGIRYLHLYNKTSAPTLSTDTPLLTIGIPIGGKATFSTDIGFAFSTGIAYAITTDDAAIPVTAATAGDVQGLVGCR